MVGGVGTSCLARAQQLSVTLPNSTPPLLYVLVFFFTFYVRMVMVDRSTYDIINLGEPTLSVL